MNGLPRRLKALEEAAQRKGWGPETLPSCPPALPSLPTETVDPKGTVDPTGPIAILLRYWRRMRAEGREREVPTPVLVRIWREARGPGAGRSAPRT